jgi:hypothetical protein
MGRLSTFETFLLRNETPAPKTSRRLRGDGPDPVFRPQRGAKPDAQGRGDDADAAPITIRNLMNTEEHKGNEGKNLQRIVAFFPIHHSGERLKCML